MVRQFFAQRCNLLRGHGTSAVPPFASFISQNVGNFLIGQCFVPRLHNRAAKFLALHRNWSLQTFENDHRRSLRTAGSEFGSSQRRILTGNTKAVGLVTSLTIGRENLFATIAWRKLGFLLLSLSCATFFRRRRSAHRIKPVTGKISRVTTEVGTAGKNREAINNDQPDRKRLESKKRLAFLGLDRRAH